MKTMKLCPKCGQPLTPDALLGLCPECMMKAGLETEAQPGGAPKPAGPAFGVAEVAKYFPQLEILDLLGQGGMGVVFKARQPQLDRLVALKIMLPEFAKDPAFAERFTREARALARLNHPNIVAVYDFGQALTPALSHPMGEGEVSTSGGGGLFYFIMEFVDGANLREMLHGGHLTPEQAFAIVPKLCDALQFAHDEGIMHRDIKPENILIDKKGRVKVADFGLAKILGQETAGEAITVTGATMGTPKYMAPEQIENSKTVDHRADIYSLGVVFYEILTGELPLGRFAPPSQRVQIDVRLDEVVLKSLEKEPGRRYQQASEVKTQLERVTSKPQPTPLLKSEAPVVPASPLAVPEAPATFPGKWRAHEIGFTILFALAFVCGAVNGIVEMSQGHHVSNMFEVPVTLVAVIGAMGLFIQYQFARPTGARAMLPEFAFAVLGACAGGLPWTWFLGQVPGWNFWQGAAFAALNFALSLFLLIVSGGRWMRLRAVAMLLAGMAGFALVMVFGNVPVHVIGSRGLFGKGPDMITVKSGLPGLYISAVLSLLTMIAGALELRRVLNPTSEPPTKGSPAIPAGGSKPGTEGDEPRLSRLALWGAIWAVLGLLAAPLIVSAIHDWQAMLVGLRHPVIILHLPVFLWVGFVVSAVVGTTIFGGVAIAQIKRSGGRLYGLPLAFAGGVVFPLLVVAFGLAYAAGHALAVTPLNARYPETVAALTLIIPLALCVFITFAAWRKIAGQPAVMKSPAPSMISPLVSAKPGHWLGHLSLGTAIGGVVLVFLLALVASMFANVTESFFLLCWALGVVLEVVALGCGIVARRTVTGKAGLIISGILLVLYIAVYLAVFALMPVSQSPRLESDLESSASQPQAGAVLKSFAPDAPTISTNLVVEGGGWFANCTQAQTLRLFEVINPGVEECRVIYRAKLKTENLQGQAYLEMWCRLPGGGEFFSKDSLHAVRGTTDWASFATPFLLRKGQKAGLIRLNLAVEGTGKVWVQDVELLKAPLP